MPEEIQKPVTNPIQAAPVQPGTSQPVATLENSEEKAKELVGATKGRNWLPIILIIIVILLLGGGVVAGLTIFKDQIPFLAANPFGKLRAGPTPTPEPEIIVPTPMPDPTADWKSFNNDKYNYIVKYPAGWSYETNKSRPSDPSSWITFFDTKTFKELTIGEPTIIIEVAQNEIVGADFDKKYNQSDFGSGLGKKIGNEVVNNLPAYREVLIGKGEQRETYSTSVVVKKDENTVVTIRTEAPNKENEAKFIDIFNKLVLTFEFKEDLNSIVWKTITSPKFKYSISIPNTWKIQPDNEGDMSDSLTTDSTWPRFSTNFQSYFLSLDINPTKFLTVEEWFNDYASKQTVRPTSTPKLISSKSGLQISLSASEGGCETSYVVLNNAYSYKINRIGGTCNISDAIFDKIFSSFKFSN